MTLRSQKRLRINEGHSCGGVLLGAPFRQSGSALTRLSGASISLRPPFLLLSLRLIAIFSFLLSFSYMNRVVSRLPFNASRRVATSIKDGNSCTYPAIYGDSYARQYTRMRRISWHDGDTRCISIVTSVKNALSRERKSWQSRFESERERRNIHFYLRPRFATIFFNTFDVSFFFSLMRCE